MIRPLASGVGMTGALWTVMRGVTIRGDQVSADLSVTGVRPEATTYTLANLLMDRLDKAPQEIAIYPNPRPRHSMPSRPLVFPHLPRDLLIARSPAI
ncbi:hypothetical protein J6590_004640 [Homalodisca vitripennis]|nr:hypothetical protein J6590_004640 [Homalodisca vitripennis]